MAVYQENLSQNDKDCLVNGYVRNESRLYVVDVAQLCLEYFDEFIYWKIDKQSFKQMMKMKFLGNDGMNMEL